MTRGFFAIGILNPKIEPNIGTLMRSAFLYDAAYVFTIGDRYTRHAADTPNTQLSIPLFNYANVEDMIAHMPAKTDLVGVELETGATNLQKYQHRERAVYLLGAEDSGLDIGTMAKCKDLVQIPTVRPYSMNVASAGSILLYDRYIKS